MPVPASSVFGVVKEEGRAGGPGKGVAPRVGAGLEESSVSVVGVESVSEGAGGDMAGRREVVLTRKASSSWCRNGAPGCPPT